MNITPLIHLATKLSRNNHKAAQRDVLSLLRFAAETTYYRAISVRSPSGNTFEEKVQAAKKRAIEIVEGIFKKKTIAAEGYNDKEHNITRHWEVAVYYAHYQSGRQLKVGNPIFPIIVSGILPKEEDLIPDIDELIDPTLQWPSLTDLEQRKAGDWINFMIKNFGEDVTLTLVKAYVNNLREGMPSQDAKKKAIEKNYEGLKEATYDTRMSVDTDFKDQLRMPLTKMNLLPVQSVFMLDFQNGQEIPIELTPSNYLEAINAWTPYTLAELEEIKKEQNFDGIKEKHYPFATR